MTFKYKPEGSEDEVEGFEPAEVEAKIAETRAAIEAEWQAKLAEKDTIIADKDKHIREKGQQFKALRDMSETEKAELSAAELELKQRQEGLEAETREFRTGQINSWKSDALNIVAGKDQKTREKVLFNYDRIVGTAQTPEEVRQRVAEAYNMIGGNKPNPLMQSHNTGGSAEEGNGEAGKDFSETKDGKDLAAALNLGL